MHTHKQTCTHTRMHAHTHTQRHTHIHLSLPHTNTQTHKQTHTHTHKHAYTQTHTQVVPGLPKQTNFIFSCHSISLSLFLFPFLFFSLSLSLSNAHTHKITHHNTGRCWKYPGSWWARVKCAPYSGKIIMSKKTLDNRQKRPLKNRQKRHVSFGSFSNAYVFLAYFPDTCKRDLHKDLSCTKVSFT